MPDDILALEDRVHRAVDRLRRLHEQRTQLHEEVRTLQLRLNDSDKASEGAGEETAGRQAWRTEKAEVVATVREAIDELRGD